MYETIKSNLEMAIRLNDKILFDIANNQITEEVLEQFSPEEWNEISTLLLGWRVQRELYTQGNRRVVHEVPNIPITPEITRPGCESRSF